eukprot:TRINITY_DN22805_c0_g1_i1.p1 TRINITY_DN22805_c0_g1~~TRINITY_DN22805_c0_g1_i1.p1  ORF type:complete len:376 (+),score=145.11 TRINITY_DN22805_c0_g1_i1:70-1197(+)
MSKKPAPKNKQQAQKAAKDLTFGMKNKNKSKKVQNYVQQVTKQQEGNAARRTGEPTKSKKQMKAEKDAEYAELFKPVVPKHAPNEAVAGVDPKTIVCEFFKQGRCTKGNKCRFSHDTSQERKSEKKSVFADSRDDPEAGTEENYMETNADWDEEKLRTVVNAKAAKVGNQTDIVCKFFITAIENNQYGWFWECPNGATCKYRHALPPGYVFKTPKKRGDEDEEEKETMEEILEKERSAIKGGTPLTLEVFLKWKEEKNKKKEEAQKKAAADRGIVTGRDLFMMNPDLVKGDDENAADDDEIHKQATENADEAAKSNAPVSLPTNPEPVGQEEEPSAEGTGEKKEENKEEKKEGGDVVIDTSVFTADEELPDDLDL